MKSLSAIALLAFSLSIQASPLDTRQDFTKIKYPAGTGENLPKYPPGTGENLPSYPSSTCPTDIFKFTSTYHVVATPDKVVNGTDKPVFTGGLSGAIGYYDFGINRNLDLICYNIRLVGFRGNYQSPARTATHVHEAVAGRNGPPRLAFPNPQGNEQERISVGCLQGPFTTGIMANGKDTGEGFKVSQIEDNPSGFFADVHSSLAVPGAVRGQLP